jgi:hypothetical protein
VSKPLITVQDFQRLLTEHEQSDVHPSDWFDTEGLDKDVFRLLVKAAQHGFPELMLEGAEQGDDPRKIMGDMCATFLLSGFALGWETHKQYGGR